MTPPRHPHRIIPLLRLDIHILFSPSCSLHITRTHRFLCCQPQLYRVAKRPCFSNNMDGPNEDNLKQSMPVGRFIPYLPNLSSGIKSAAASPGTAFAIAMVGICLAHGFALSSLFAQKPFGSKPFSNWFLSPSKQSSSSQKDPAPPPPQKSFIKVALTDIAKTFTMQILCSLPVLVTLLFVYVDSSPTAPARKGHHRVGLFNVCAALFFLKKGCSTSGSATFFATLALSMAAASAALAGVNDMGLPIADEGVSVTLSIRNASGHSYLQTMSVASITQTILFYMAWVQALFTLCAMSRKLAGLWAFYELELANICAALLFVRKGCRTSGSGTFLASVALAMALAQGLLLLLTGIYRFGKPVDEGLSVTLSVQDGSGQTYVQAIPIKFILRGVAYQLCLYQAAFTASAMSRKLAGLAALGYVVVKCLESIYVDLSKPREGKDVDNRMM
ncbi:hypothetical protein B0H63DRAFT_558320 [Podospora didyma]|uniref:Uncharacterized protein n=1 Tax=Podospora didyma TaxID=330526 RepID=A0AAE0NS46_9PEZI|nr:hypothetical protein B0H63DRAFT_558320 [Podospora didyma]